MNIADLLSNIIKTNLDRTNKSNKNDVSRSIFDLMPDKIDDIYKLSDNSTAMSGKITIKDTAINDRYMNSITADGSDNVLRSFTNYGFSNDTLNFGLWLCLYNDSWVFRRAIDKPAEDEINCGIIIKGQSDYSKAYAAYNKHKTTLIKLLKWGALFGGAIGVMMFKGMSDADYAKPLDNEKIKQPMKIYVADRWYGCSPSVKRVSDMSDVDYGLPESYLVTFADGHQIQVHHSFILRYEHRDAPNLVKNGQLQGWGYAEGTHILNELARDDQLKSAITTMVDKANIEVIKMAGMKGLFLGVDQETEEQLRARLEMVNWGRNYNSLTFLDKDDDYQMNTFSGLSGLSDILEQNLWLISAALEMQGILYGNLQGGLSTDTDDMGRYAITIKNRCNAYVRPVIYKFLKVMFIRYDIPGKVDFDFNSINLLEDNNKQVDSLKSLGEVLRQFKDDGIISTYQMALSLKTFVDTGTIGIAITDERLEYLKLLEEQELAKQSKSVEENKTDIDNEKNIDFDEDFDKPYNPESDILTESKNTEESPTNNNLPNQENESDINQSIPEDNNNENE